MKQLFQAYETVTFPLAETESTDAEMEKIGKKNAARSFATVRAAFILLLYSLRERGFAAVLFELLGGILSGDVEFALIARGNLVHGVHHDALGDGAQAAGS